MQDTRKTYLIGGMLALFVAAAAGGAGAAAGRDSPGPTGQRIAAQAKADRQACDRLQGNTRDICQAEAKGREKVARAELEARSDPTPEAEQALKEARADADYAVARQRCDDAKGKKATKACIARAKAVHEAAVRQAKVEKVHALNALKDKQEDRHASAAKEESPQARYKARKALCLTMGTERDSCMAELQRKFGKS